MSVRIKNPETVALVRALADQWGVGPTKAISIAVNQALQRDREARERDDAEREGAIEALQDRVAALPVLDGRPWRELRADQMGEACESEGRSSEAA